MKINHLFGLVAIITSCFIMSCSNDDDGGNNGIELFAEFTVNNQDVIDNAIVVESAFFPEDGWIVIHRDNGAGGPVVPAIISEPKFVSAGTSTDIMVEFAESETVSNGETIWVMLHTDDGVSGTYEFDGANGFDAPLISITGDVLITPIVLNTPPTASFSVDDQTIADNTIIVSSATFDRPGWIVIHRDNGSDGPVVPGIISTPKLVEAGTSTDIEVELAEGESVSNEETIWVMLHTDNGVSGTYEFDGANGFDGPIVADGSVLVTPIVVSTAPTGSFTAENQTISQNTITVATATFDRSGWIVIHKDNGSGGPVVPGIISVPMMVDAGTSTNIEVELATTAEITDGETLWIMLHTDTGVAGTYEFDGANGFDGPIIDDGNIVMSSIEVSAPSITAVDQPVTGDQIIIAEVFAAVDGWIVVHNDNGSGEIELPGIIGRTKVNAGVNTNVVIDLDATNTYTVGQKLFPMLHIDESPLDEYNFPGVDLPELYSFTNGEANIIVTAITVE